MNGAKVRLSGNKILQLNFLLSQLHETNAHLGEFKYVWNRDLGLFLYGIYNYHCVFDLRLTVLYLKKMLMLKKFDMTRLNIKTKYSIA